MLNTVKFKSKYDEEKLKNHGNKNKKFRYKFRIIRVVAKDCYYVCLFVCCLVPLKKFSLVRKCQQWRGRAVNFDLYSAIMAN